MSYMYTCDECAGVFQGLSFAIPDEAWRAISTNGDLSGVLCLWCANARLLAAGLSVEVEVNVNLPAMIGTNNRAIRRMQEIDIARSRS